MDVHPPHTPIHGWKDFVLHLFTITVGLLIALGLEAAVEHMHHKHQLREARESIHAELSKDRRDLQQLQVRLKEQNKGFADLLADIESVRTNRPPSVEPKLFVTGVSLSRASWDTARASGALELMPYDEASRLADVYQVQGIFDQIQVDTINAYAPLLGSLSANLLTDLQKLSPAQLDSIEDKVRACLGHSRVFIGAAHELDLKYADSGVE